ncbi:MAG: translation initiation factor [Bdellovibrionales bacterium]
MSSDKNKRLVWSDDPKDKAKISESDKQPDQQAPLEFVASHKWVAVFRIEKGGRGGKIVTVIDQLPMHETFLSLLCKELKAKCGSGGTFRLAKGAGLIEIQGDKRDQIKAIFTQKGYRYKGM